MSGSSSGAGVVLEDSPELGVLATGLFSGFAWEDSPGFGASAGCLFVAFISGVVPDPEAPPPAPCPELGADDSADAFSL